MELQSFRNAFSAIFNADVTDFFQYFLVKLSNQQTFAERQLLCKSNASLNYSNQSLQPSQI
jgi:hypothetical protein